jgi:hypothetical protein
VINSTLNFPNEETTDEIWSHPIFEARAFLLHVKKFWKTGNHEEENKNHL